MKLGICAFILILMALPVSFDAAAQTKRTPEQVFEGIRSACNKRNRKEALKYATQKVVRQLFDRLNARSPYVTWDYGECEKEGRSYHCFLTYPGGGINLWISKIRGKYFVTRVFAIAD